MVASNTVVLRATLEDRRKQSAPEMKESEYFELFCAEQLLKSRDLSYDEIAEGMVGGGGDGGIDAAYAFVSGELVTDDFDPSPHKQDISIDLVIITANTRVSYEEACVDKLRITSAELLDLGKNMDDYAATYNGALRGILDNFRRALISLSAAFPQVRVQYYYVTHGDTGDIDQKVRTKASLLETQIAKLLPNPECSFQFVGASELLGIARSSPVGSSKLPLASSAVTTETGFICLVKLSEYYRFITDDDGELKRSMLEANVRDYQGDVEVNRAIRDTLNAPHCAREDFWALNNGITVVASNGAITGSTLSLKDPRIVNGLQTSVEIFKHFHANPAKLADEPRTMLVRVALTEDDAYRDRVIRATNSQTAIHPASLRATEPIHRNIEDYFRTKGLFYDRRKNYYKNQGMPKEKIVTISHLAQAVTALVLGEPDNSRARPSSLLKKEDDYARVFNEQYPMDMYLTCALIMSRVDDLLRSGLASLTKDERTNLRFYVAMCAAHELLGKHSADPAELTDLDPELLTDDSLVALVGKLRQWLLYFANASSIPSDQAAKSPQFRQYVLEQEEGTGE
jgi:hypothetical protein